MIVVFTFKEKTEYVDSSPPLPRETKHTNLIEIVNIIAEPDK